MRAKDRLSMDASATRALLATGLLLVAACVVAARPAAADVSVGVPVEPDAAEPLAPEPEELADAVESPEPVEPPDPVQPPESVELPDPVVPPEPEELLTKAQLLGAAAEPRVAGEPRRAEAEPPAAHAEPLAATPEPHMAQAPQPDRGAAAAPGPVATAAPAPQTADPEPQPAVEPQQTAARPPKPAKPDRGAKLVAEVDRRLRAVEHGLREARRTLAAGERRPDGLARELRRDVQRLAPAVETLERHAAAADSPVPGMRRIEARLGRARGAAAALVARLRESGTETWATRALIAELVAFQRAGAAAAPSTPADPRRAPKRGEQRVAYTQLHGMATALPSEAAGAHNGGPSARGIASREGPPRAPAPTRIPATGAAAAPTASILLVGVPAALALLVGLVIPRLLRRLARREARRRPEPFSPPRERPG
jgi:hypothetical protein